ncbi:zinc finger CCCH domain-containing protein 13-like [Rhinichthys klamathensis goyatoka]|uniref:zinc finger CCCH domain-containing protein 13-like n=1 Tax=Rhinichthys klamathensis goyatoka TaxID=3034132 RepID=UPI0024B48195|nr:zinc finger CCCH domain-containing protein 13-like [Rhinichthys klamathensis goyatoka]
MAAPITPAEMQRRYREKRDADPERREMYLQKEREKWQRDRETGKKKRVADLSEHEKRAQRKKWRERKRETKARKKARPAIPSPPATTLPPELEPVAEYSRQRQQGQRQKSRNKKRFQRDIEKLKVALVKEKAKKEKYKKRWQRSQTKTNSDGQSPRAQLAKILPDFVDPSTRRKLLLQASIIEELKNKYKNTRREREKQIIAKATTARYSNCKREGGIILLEGGRQPNDNG